MVAVIKAALGKSAARNRIDHSRTIVPGRREHKKRTLKI
jgi:hypothetical protein